jgi:hypothetical protein
MFFLFLFLVVEMEIDYNVLVCWLIKKVVSVRVCKCNFPQRNQLREGRREGGGKWTKAKKWFSFFSLLQNDSVQNLFFLGGYDSRFFFKSIVDQKNHLKQSLHGCQCKIRKMCQTPWDTFLHQNQRIKHVVICKLPYHCHTLNIF